MLQIGNSQVRNASICEFFDKWRENFEIFVNIILHARCLNIGGLRLTKRKKNGVRPVN